MGGENTLTASTAATGDREVQADLAVDWTWWSSIPALPVRPEEIGLAIRVPGSSPVRPCIIGSVSSRRDRHS